MGLVLGIVFAFSVEIVLWAIGLKPFDGFLLALVLITIGATLRMIKPYLPGRE
ncbi:MAG TPA: hypothetical protein VHZ31_00775 [Solirubrobacteraceae bacterium]|jgi:hypothetical protein|nr:hypothetical protein [Solirubrobacteraceae bacterium]